MFRHRGIRRALAPAICLLLVAGVAACGDDDDDSATGGGGGGGDSLQIALLLPETKTARYETQDRPLFEAKVEELCAECEILYSNADQDAAEQQSQAEAALTNGADVLVLDPVDGASAGSIVAQAKSQDVPVISYDRLHHRRRRSTSTSATTTRRSASCRRPPSSTSSRPTASPAARW